MPIWFVFVALIVLASYAAWVSVSSILEWRGRDPRPSFRHAIRHERRWGKAVLVGGAIGVVLVVILVVIGVSRFDLVLATSPTEWLLFAACIAVFAALFFAVRALLRRFGKREWLTVLSLNGYFVLCAVAVMLGAIALVTPAPR